ncbi:hypothetical protein F5B18DRAFT_111025 [Nemania serpens]|nr:hypothetical protein F5B18DRAFT_111025 [Nemania serpens]
MCRSTVCFNYCYECAREFNHKTHIVRCRATKNSHSCTSKQTYDYVIQTSENCRECKASRLAEEECQRMIYRSRPLCLDIKGKERMSALLACYR